jgi:hypothetical protein
VTDLNHALTSINRVLQENSVATASFNFKKKTAHYQVWFNLLIPRDKNLKIIQRLSEIPEITQVETGSSEVEFPPTVPPGTPPGVPPDMQHGPPPFDHPDQGGDAS